MSWFGVKIDAIPNSYIFTQVISLQGMKSIGRFYLPLKWTNEWADRRIFTLNIALFLIPFDIPYGNGDVGFDVQDEASGLGVQSDPEHAPNIVPCHTLNYPNLKTCL